jgi:hypothetical protein
MHTCISVSRVIGRLRVPYRGKETGNKNRRKIKRAK